MLVQAVAIMERGTPEEILNLAFRMYDVNGNGTIEMRELAEILQVSIKQWIRTPDYNIN
jgi:Ca2+-binding EF-hand superfamily protein